MNVDELQVTDRNRNSMLGFCVCVCWLFYFLFLICVWFHSQVKRSKEKYNNKKSEEVENQSYDSLCLAHFQVKLNNNEIAINIKMPNMLCRLLGRFYVFWCCVFFFLSFFLLLPRDCVPRLKTYIEIQESEKKKETFAHSHVKCDKITMILCWIQRDSLTTYGHLHTHNE